MDQFNIEYQYQLYLERVGLKNKRLHPEQSVQLRRTFFAAIGQFIVLLKEQFPLLTEAESGEKMQQMFDEITQFFFKETNQLN